jgi:hypothetical protein
MLNNIRGRRPTPSLQNHAAAVSQILLQLGINPQQAQMTLQEGYGWSFRRGSALIEVYISVLEGVGYLQVLSPIMHLPPTGILPLYRRLLELNLQLTAASLGVNLDVVYVYHERPLEGLDADEANVIINTIASYADDLDDRLINEFGGRMYQRISGA